MRDPDLKPSWQAGGPGGREVGVRAFVEERRGVTMPAWLPMGGRRARRRREERVGRMNGKDG